MNVLIGVDIGTQGTKAAAFSASGRPLASAFVPSTLHRPAPDAVEEDPQQQYDSVCLAIRRCARLAKLYQHRVLGIGVAGQMAGILGVDRSGRHVTPYDSWLDTRCCAQIERMEQEAGERIIERTGGAVGINHGPKILWWKERRPEVYRRIAAFVQPGGYAAMRLCELGAADAFIDHTYLHFSGFADNQRGQWDADLCAQFGVEIEKLPRIVPPRQIMGELTRTAAVACGLRPGVPVIAGCGDTAGSFLACGAARAGVAADVAGTASVFAATAETFGPDLKHRMLACGRSAVPGLWHPYAYIAGGGMNLKWFVDSAAPGISLAALDRAAARLRPRLDDPLFLPHLGGRACPAAAHLRGAWANLCWNHTRTHLYRAVLEAVTLEYALYLRTLRELYPGRPVRELRVCGGGAKSKLWNQIKATALGAAVRPVRNSSGAAAGAAMIAAWAVSEVKDLPAAVRQWVRVGSPVRPGSRALVEPRLAAYQRLTRQLEVFGREQV